MHESFANAFLTERGKTFPGNLKPIYRDYEKQNYPL